jgi:hypothetical protein
VIGRCRACGMTQMGSWLDLAPDYFAPVCREIFDEYMRGHNFVRDEANDDGYVTYRRGDRFLKFHYYVEDSPKFSPMISIGLAGAAAPRPGFDRIGLWYAIPANREERDYGLWRYSNAAELNKVFTRIRGEVVDVYARPLWENPKELAELVRQRHKEAKAERDAEIEGEMLRRQREQAEGAFRSHDYSKAAALYGQIGDSKLSAVERKRYELSKKHISGKGR